MNPLVSILIPAYNSEKWIRATIQSAVDQTWRNKEIIVVDDGSTDNTLQIAREFESKSVKVLSQSNSGACAARNRAFSVCQGDYIQWLDSDDLLALNKIEIQLADGVREGVLHSGAWGRFHCRLMGAIFRIDGLWQDLCPVDWLLFHIGDGYVMHSAAWLVSRKLSELSGKWDERILKSQDGEYFCRVVANSELVKFHPNAMSYYRRGNFSSTSNVWSKRTAESLNLSDNLSVDHLLNRENNEITREACVRFLQRSLSRSHPGESGVFGANQQRITELGGTCSLPSRSRRSKSRIGFWMWKFQVAAWKNWDRLAAVIDGDGI